MYVVHKFKLSPGDNEISMPDCAELLCVGVQNDQLPYLWARVDTRQPMAKRKILMVGTGHQMPDGASYTYIGTAIGVEGWLVFHAFEVQ